MNESAPQTIEINGTIYYYVEDRFECEDGEDMWATYTTGDRKLPQELFYEDEYGTRIGLHPNSPFFE